MTTISAAVPPSVPAPSEPAPSEAAPSTPAPPRPAVKAVFAPIDVATDVVSLGFPRTPLSARIADPDGWVRAVLHTLDGERSVPEVVARFAGSVTATDIRRLVDALAVEGFIEDASTPPPADLTAAEIARYSRNAEFFSYFTDRRPGGFQSPHAADAPTRYSPQLDLRDATVTVVGVGGLGSHIAVHLASLGVGRLCLVDDDDVELSNLNRQLLFREGDVGRPKVDVAAGRLRELNPLVEITTSRSRIRSAADVETWMLGTDLTVCAADRPRVDIDRWFNAAALRLRRPWLRGANIGLSAALDLFVPGRTACAECRLDSEDGDDANSRIVDQLRVGTTRGTSPCISPVAGLLGSIAALEAMKFLTGVSETVLLDNQVVVDLLTTEIHHLPDPPVPTCSVCSVTSGAAPALAVPA